MMKDIMWNMLKQCGAPEDLVLCAEHPSTMEMSFQGLAQDIVVGAFGQEIMISAIIMEYLGI